MKSAFGIPMSAGSRSLVSRGLARQSVSGGVPYNAVVPAFGPGRSAWEMEGVDWRTVDSFGRAPLDLGAATPSPGTDETAALVQRYGPAAGALVAQLLADDPRSDVAKYSAKVDNLRTLVSRSPRVTRGLLERQLRLAEGRLAAARERRAWEAEGERSTRTWRVLGYTLGATGIVVGLSVTVLLLAGAQAVSQGRRR